MEPARLAELRTCFDAVLTRTMCKHGLMRVLIVYGSETGCSEGAVKKLAKKWSASKSANKFKICDTLSGDTAADRFGTIKDDYDMVVVSTSSFGEGDAPNGYGKFLYELQQGAKNGTKPLAGVLHAVLGYGSSEFETFQNCPRLTDKYLGECGSRRCVQRTEIDQLDEFKDVDAALDKFEAAVLAVLSSPSDTDSPPVCAWSVPGDTILEKKLNPMGYEEASLDSPNGSMMMIAGVGAAVLAVGVYMYRDYFKMVMDA